jgi:hypothetical protein
MLDKGEEQRRSRTVIRGFAAMLVDLGFVKDVGGSCIRLLGTATCKVWLQKFRKQPAFRVAMSFKASDASESVTEFGDRWTYRDSPAGRQFNFSIRWGDDAAERCLQEIHDFVETVAIPWFEAQAAASKHA